MRQVMKALSVRLPWTWYLMYGGKDSSKEPYNENVFCRSEAETLKRAEYRLRIQAAHLGFQIIPTNN